MAQHFKIPSVAFCSSFYSLSLCWKAETQALFRRQSKLHIQKEPAKRRKKYQQPHDGLANIHHAILSVLSFSSKRKSHGQARTLLDKFVAVPMQPPRGMEWWQK